MTRPMTQPRILLFASLNPTTKSHHTVYLTQLIFSILNGKLNIISTSIIYSSIPHSRQCVAIFSFVLSSFFLRLCLKYCLSVSWGNPFKSAQIWLGQIPLFAVTVVFALVLSFVPPLLVLPLFSWWLLPASSATSSVHDGQMASLHLLTGSNAIGQALHTNRIQDIFFPLGGAATNILLGSVSVFLFAPSLKSCNLYTT